MFVFLHPRIRRVLRDYPAGSQSFRELVQNADDAGAESVKFYLLKGDTKSGAYLHQGFGDFSGPSLYTWNDASFSEEDFKAIRNIGASSKKSDATKTGKFGLGFNAVYHFTDLPSFITGSFLVIMDPHQRMLLGKDWERAFARRWDFLEPSQQDSCKGHAKWFDVKDHPCSFSEKYSGWDDEVLEVDMSSKDVWDVEMVPSQEPVCFGV